MRWLALIYISFFWLGSNLALAPSSGAFGVICIFVSYMARICYWHLRHLWFERSLPKVERNLIKFDVLQILFVRLDLFQAKLEIR